MKRKGIGKVKMKQTNIKAKVIRNSIIAILAVIAFNLTVIYSLGSPQMAFLQIKKYLPLLILLVGGFGVQVGLYTYLKHKSMVCSVTSMASGGVSSISMILCCSHYLVNILPFISLSAVSFLTRYTLQILLFGVVSNMVGIAIMIKRIKEVKG